MGSRISAFEITGIAENEVERQCNSECKIIKCSHQETSYPDIESLVNYLYNDLSKACSNKPSPVPKLMAIPV
ncbi:hypothetical protein CISIN_1g040334mg [Citrus sinensis]|uniref:Uncharacterized protein n=1 Tax=Citrus sinensis TaxID=2711 RepID=A0A067EZJ0_CITSI|nr:hypothetical protein CISIN_1g040334mg [Citrus sinensis]